jgi:hypothetical protein
MALCPSLDVASMDAFVDTLLWLLVIFSAIFVMAVLALFFLTKYWQNKTMALLKEVRGRLRSYERQIHELRQSARAYDPSDEEPFGSLASELSQKAEGAEGQFRQLYSSFSRHQKKARLININLIEDWKELTSILRMPYEWYLLQQKNYELEENEENTTDQIQAAKGLLKRLSSLGPEVALQARKVIDQSQAAQRGLSELQSAGVRDPLVDAAYQDAREWEKRLKAQVPVYFLNSREDQLEEKADKASIIAVYKLVSDAGPPVSVAHEQSITWKRRYEALEGSIEELIKEYRSLAEIISSLETKQAYPLNWDHSRNQLADARQSIESLSASIGSRTLKQVDQDLASAARNLKLLNDLSSHCQKIASYHSELVTLLDNSDLKQGAEWGRKAQKLAVQVEAYDPENWPRTSTPHRLREEIQSLLELHKGLKFQDPSSPVAESELAVALDEVRQLTDMHKEIRPRFGAVQERLLEVQETERNTREVISRTRALVNQSVSIVNSNHHLAKVASQDAESLRAEIEILSDQIEARSEGTVDKKAEFANATVRKAEQAANRWLDKLEDEMDSRKAALAEKVGVLDNIAILDEPALIEAEKLLSTKETVEEPASRRSSRLPALPFTSATGEKRRRQKESLSLSEAVNELKRKNEEWHRCIAAMRAIEDIEPPILEQYERAEGHAEKAQSALEQTRQLISEERSWPPTTVYIGNERRQFETLERQWSVLKQEHLRAIQLVNRLGEMSDAYQDLEKRVSQLVERAQQERDRIEDLEQRFGESLRMWEYQMQAYSSNLYAKDEIQMLLADANNEAEAIRSRYLNGDIPYPQVLQALRSLCQRIESAPAPLDKELLIDINGVVQRR